MINLPGMKEKDQGLGMWETLLCSPIPSCVCVCVCMLLDIIVLF